MTSDELEHLKVKKEIWEKAVDTQMHFNEVSVKTRQLGLTFVVAALGLAAVLVSRGQGYGVTIPGWGHLHVASLIVLIAAIGMFAVRTLDLRVYHRMLRGAVTFGEKLEEELRSDGLFNVTKGMTESISSFSRYEEVDMTTLEGKGEKETAFDKISRFYTLSIAVLLVFAVGLAYAFKNVEVDKPTPVVTSDRQEKPSTPKAEPETKRDLGKKSN